MKIKIALRIASAVLAAASLLLALSFTPARSDDKRGLLYATVWPSPPSQVAIIDLNTETVTVNGNTEFTDSGALAICPEGVAYSIPNIFEEPSPSHLAILDLRTGAETQVGSPIPPGQDMMALECSRPGILYAVGGSDPTNSGYNALYVINRVTGQLYRIGSTGVNDTFGDDMFMALRFAPGGRLYAANVFSLYTIDTKAGLATKVVDFSDNVKGNVMGLAIEPNGNFYIADYNADPTVPQVYSLNPYTGQATPIVSAGYAFVHSIAFRPHAHHEPDEN